MPVNIENTHYVYFIQSIDLTFNAIKMGICHNWRDRTGGYITTSPYNIPKLIYLIQCESEHTSHLIESILHNFYDNYNTRHHKTYNNGGREWFNIKLPTIDKIKDILSPYNLTYKLIHDTELIDYIRDLKRTIKTSELKYIQDSKVLFASLTKQSTSLRNYQSNIYNNKSQAHYRIYDRGIINWACGLGKTITSLFISTDYVNNKLFIGLPNTAIIKQWLATIATITKYTTFKILVVASNEDNFVGLGHVNKYCQLVDSGDIIKYTKSHSQIIVLSTYHSSHKLKPINFDFGIYDECHHLCGSKINDINNETKKFTDALQIPCTKRLFLSATLKEIESTDHVDNFDQNTFGPVIDTKSFKWAIENKYITDYRFITLRTTSNALIEIMSSLGINTKNMELFLAAYMTITQAMECYNKLDPISHIIIYCNKIEHAEIVCNFISQILSKKFPTFTNVYNKVLHSEKRFNLTEELDKFRAADIGIISCVYIFGEGFDEKCINACTVAECMISTIRVVQSLMRANRLHKSDKIASYLCPFIDDDNTTEFQSFNKLKKILQQLGKYDENVIDKIVNVPLNDSKTSAKSTESKYVKFNDAETQNIRVWVRHRNVLSCDNWDENEYYYYKNLCQELGITTKHEYLLAKSKFDTIGEPYIINPEKHFTVLSTTIWKSWYDFLSIDVSKFPRTKEQLKKICIDNKITSNTYKNLWSIYNLPEYPQDLYLDFTNLGNLLNAHNTASWELLF